MNLRSFLVFLCVPLLASCGFFSSESRTFTYCSEGSPTSFNPQRASDSASFDASSQPLYNRLLSFNPKTMELEPSLATSWKFEDGGKRVVFDLRKEVPFHKRSYFSPSRFFNADDVIFTFKSMRAPAPDFYTSSSEYFRSSGLEEILDRVEKVSDHRVKFHLKKADSSFLNLMAMDFTSLLSKEYGDYLLSNKKAHFMDDYPIGTGPFQFQNYVKNRVILYEAFKGHFQGTPQIQKLKFKIVPQSHKRVEMVSKGECDFIKSPSLESLNELSDVEDVKVIESPSLNVSYLAMNMRFKKFKNKNFRFALAHALNRRSYLSAVYGGKAVLAHSPLPPQMQNTKSFGKVKVQELEYNLQKAKDYMDKSGLDTPIAIKLWTLPITRPYNPDGKKMGEMIKEDLRQIGVEVSLETFDWPTFLRRSKDGEHELIQYGWLGDSLDPGNYLQTLLSCSSISAGSNLAAFCNSNYDSYLERAKSAKTTKERAEFYTKALSVFRTELPWIPLAHANVFRIMQKNVMGYEQSPFGTESFFKTYKKEWDAK